MNRPSAREQAELDVMAEQAFEAHAALVRAESDMPGLSGNPYWRALREAAYARFHLVYLTARPR